MVRSRAEVELDCVDWAEGIARSYRPDLVVFLAKSGFLFARPVAQVLGCEMVDLKVGRPGNGGKDAVARLAPRVPLGLVGMALGSRLMYGFNEAAGERELALTPRSRKADFASYGRVLLVDDSVDTGWSILKALGFLRESAPDAEVRVAAYCVISGSERRARVDYRRFTDTIVLTATSRFSGEHGRFLADYRRWSEG